MSSRVAVRAGLVLSVAVVHVLLLTTCTDFFGAEDLKEIMRDEVKAATAPAVQVTFRAENDTMGVPTPYGTQTLRVGIATDITTTVGRDYTFVRWTHSGGAGDVTFGNPTAISTSVTINVARDGILVSPTFARRPYPLAWDPYTGNTGVITNKVITAAFNQPLDPSTLILAPDGTVRVQTWPSGSPDELVSIEEDLELSLNGGLVSISLVPGHRFLAFHTIRITMTPEIRDLNGTGMAQEFSWFFTTGSGEDTQPPVINSFRIRNARGEVSDSGAVDVYTNGTQIRLLVAAVDDQQQVRWLEVRETPDPGETITTLYDYLGDRPHELSRTDDGLTTIMVRVADESDNWTTETPNPPLNQKRVHLDTVPPTIASFQAGSTPYTNTATVSIAVGPTDGTGSPVSGYRLTESADEPLVWDAWPPPSAVTLSAGDGLKTVYLWVRDAAGNTAHEMDTITLDTVSPTVDVGLISTTGNPGYVRNGQSITIDFQVTEEGSGLAATPTVTIAGQTAIVTGAYPAFAAIHEFSGTAASQGPVTFVISATDNAGNELFHTGPTGIVYDRTPPTITSFPLPQYTKSTGQVFTITATDATSGIARYEVYGDGVASGFEEFTSDESVSASFTLTDVEGSKAVTVRITDAAGNSTIGSYTTTLDTVDPTIASFELNGGATYTNDPEVSLDVGAMDGTGTPIAHYNVTQTSGEPVSGWTTTKPTSHTLTGGEGLNTVYFWVRDAAGNAAYAMDTITLDTVEPVISGDTLEAAATGITGFTVTDDGGSGVDAGAFTVNGVADGRFDGTSLTGLEAPTEGNPEEYILGAADNAGNETTVTVRHEWVAEDTFAAEILGP